MITHSATLEINERVAALRSAGRPILHLGFGEAGIPPLPELVDKLCGSASDTSYAPVAGSDTARTAAASYWRRRGLDTSAEQMLLAPGSKALLFAALTVLDGDVVLPQPSWVTYAAQAMLARKRVIRVPVPAECGGVPDPDLLERDLRRARADGADPRILIVTLPDNPTGTLAPEHVVRRVCEIADRNGLVIISDEIYRDLTHDGSGFTSPAAFLPERTIVTCGLSKNLALGGWRIGFARVPGTAEGLNWRSAMRGVASEIWAGMSSPMDAVAALALSEPDVVVEHIRRSRGLHAAVASAVFDVFGGADVDVRRPTAGFYLYPDFESMREPLAKRNVHDGVELSRFLLDEHGVAVLPGVSFGDHPESLQCRVATSLLYGSENDRWTALDSDDPAALPWVSASLRRLGDVLDALR